MKNRIFSPHPEPYGKTGSQRHSLSDTFGRPLRNLRLSVTDRCNLRCRYCMPEENYVWLPREDLLTFEEIGTLVDVFTGLAVDGVRLTGGEPLLRRDLHALVRMLAQNHCLKDIAITTNGILLTEQANALYDAGLHRMTVSLDTLSPERFKALTKRDDHAHVLEGIEAVRRAGFDGLKIDTVVMRGTNEDELVDLLEYGREIGAEVRFIEYMDVGGATQWSTDKVISQLEMLDILRREYGQIEPIVEDSSAPAQRYVLPNGTLFGIIASTTAPFCRSCNRSRLTADGMWYLCLYARNGIDLRQPLRDGASHEEIMSIIVDGWTNRMNRGAEERKELRFRGVLAQTEELRRDAHLEMHTRGG